jgi:hypothetical protein
MASETASGTPLSRKDLETKIVARAWQDDAFRQKFVSDPKSQFEERLGHKLPAALKMTVHEEDENNVHFVIPMKPKVALDELSDAELEKVAGGTDVLVTIATAVSAAVTFDVMGDTWL